MDLERFTDLLDIHGADLALWPEAERKAADKLLAASPLAREQQRKAAAFDRLLLNAQLPEIEPSDALRQRILAQLGPRVAAQPNWRMQIVEALALLFPTGRAMPQFAALAFALALGVSAGFVNFGLLDAQETDLVSVQIASATPFLSED